MEAVILWQSVQLQMNELTNPGPWVGCGQMINKSDRGSNRWQPHKFQLHSAAKARRRSFLLGGKTVISNARQRNVGF
jgi:hypothetical protein